jgi:hypothetical protein
MNWFLYMNGEVFFNEACNGYQRRPASRSGCELCRRVRHKRWGITAKVIPVLNGSREQLKNIRTKAAEECADISIIDFSEIAQKCTDYDTYMVKMGNTGYDDIEYIGVCLYGPDKKVNSLTGSLPLLR